ncbi:hypothetical protein L596_016787 [Steinernema carpocapsae]|uniref:Uncharacterized protein n=1 Tax=Steinernema carpocapsae TaxID=34508 RepID=A0A4U5NK39_STECR|nr:hypothetical protein L596_016787 [Steinernema carpocapsae]
MTGIRWTVECLVRIAHGEELDASERIAASGKCFVKNRAQIGVQAVLDPYTAPARHETLFCPLPRGSRFLWLLCHELPSCSTRRALCTGVPSSDGSVSSSAHRQNSLVKKVLAQARSKCEARHESREPEDD